MKRKLLFIHLFLMQILIHLTQSSAASPQQAQYDGEMTQTLTRKIKEQQAFQDSNNQLHKRKQGVETFSFELKDQSQEFYLHLEEQIEMIMSVRIFIKQDHLYSQISNISREPPTMVYVYENNNRMIFNQSFYFYGSIRFKGQRGSNYMFRFFSTSQNKVVIAQHTKVFDRSIFQNKLQETSTEQHNLKLNALFQKFHLITRPIRQNHLVYDNNRKQLQNKLYILINYHIFETVILCIVSLFQIKLVNGMLTNKEII